MRIVVLAGGLSPERNVSLSSGTMITEALCRLGHQAVLVDQFLGLESWPGTLEERFSQPFLPGIDTKKISTQAPDLKALKAGRKDPSDSLFGTGVLNLCRMADAVFLALHGASGEDGRVQATLDLLGIPYTGSGFLGAALAMDKDLTKRAVAGQVNTPRWRTAVCTRENLEELVAGAGYPLVVKPIAGGSSLGVSIADTPDQLRAALEENLGGKIVLEQYIKGREIQVGILNDKALPSIEIIPKTGFYDYANKYQPGAAEEVCPAPIAPDAEEQLEQAALRAYHAVGLSVYARADFILDECGTPWFLEINTLPGMTPTSLLPQEAAAVGIDYESLCQTILDVSLETRKRERGL